MDIGRLRHYVTLDDPVPDGTPVTFTPSVVKAAVEPGAPGSFDEQRVSYRVVIRYHPQVTFNTRITLESGAQLLVKGIQNVEMKNRVLELLCEEVQTP
jgi:hypothetical protein